MPRGLHVCVMPSYVWCSPGVKKMAALGFTSVAAILYRIIKRDLSRGYFSFFMKNISYLDATCSWANISYINVFPFPFGMKVVWHSRSRVFWLVVRRHATSQKTRERGTTFFRKKERKKRLLRDRKGSRALPTARVPPITSKQHCIIECSMIILDKSMSRYVREKS